MIVSLIGFIIGKCLVKQILKDRIVIIMLMSWLDTFMTLI